jgi:hypothetical protein
MNLAIDPEFESLIAPLAAEEHVQLEANLLAEGCHDALMVWAGEAPASGDDGGPEVHGQIDGSGLAGRALVRGHSPPTNSGEPGPGSPKGHAPWSQSWQKNFFGRCSSYPNTTFAVDCHVSALWAGPDGRVRHAMETREAMHDEWSHPTPWSEVCRRAAGRRQHNKKR